jgi:hypothetical protein
MGGSRDRAQNARHSGGHSLLPHLLSCQPASAPLLKNPLYRILEKDESVVNFLGVIDEYLAKLELTCTFDVQGASSPQEMEKAIYVARNKIQSTIAAMEDHLRSFRHHRRKDKRRQNQRKRLKKSLEKPLG